jgi:hypothetical protein
VRLLFSAINLYLFILLRLGGGGVLHAKNIQSGSFYISCCQQNMPRLVSYLGILGSALPFLVEGAGVSTTSLYTGFYSFAFFLNTERITVINARRRSRQLTLFTISFLFSAAV